MRLTNAAQVDLPAGRVRSLSVDAAPTERLLPVSFDQARHVAGGQRPGSWMAVVVRLPSAVDLATLRTAWSSVLARHGTLRSGFEIGPEGDLVARELTVHVGEWVEHDPRGRSSRDVVRDVLDQTCRPFDQPSHRVCLVDDDRPAVVVGVDHAHVDAWSLLVLARDLSAALQGGEQGRVPAFADHTVELRARDAPPDAVQQRWHEIIAAGGGVMPRFPRDLGDVSVPRPEVVEVRDVLDTAGLARLEALAAALDVGIVSVAIAAMAGALGASEQHPVRAVFPVHSRYDQRWHASVGWFITNSVLEVHDPDPRACRAAIKEAIELGSHPLEPLMAPYGGMPAAAGMFAVSWLDHRRLPVELPAGLQLQHVSSVIETDGVMIWFVVNHDGLHLRCRYPDTPAARASVGGWLDDVCDGLDQAVSSSPPSSSPSSSTGASH